MGFINNEKLEYITENLVKAENIKVSSHRGHTLKNVLDNIENECNGVSESNIKTLENRVSRFKIGQGRNTDMSWNVQPCTVNLDMCGQTYQNLVSKITRINGTQNCDVNILDINKVAFEAKYKYDTTGNTSVNRAVINTTDLPTMFKPNTEYTFIYKYTLLENPYDEQCMLGIAIDVWGANLGNSESCKRVGYSNVNVTKASTPADIETFNDIRPAINFINKSGRNSKWRIENLMILEGDYTQTPINELPGLFKNIKSSFENGIVDVTVKGKNLFNPSKLITKLNNNVEISLSGDKFIMSGIIDDTYTSFNTGNTLTEGTYTVRIYNKGSFWGTNAKIWGFNSKGQLIANVSNGYSFTVTEEVTQIKLVIQGFSAGSKVDAEVTVQLERSEYATEYEPYYNKNVRFNIDSPLLSLPNGICDEIRYHNGKYELVRRVQKRVLNGTEGWVQQGTGSSSLQDTAKSRIYQLFTTSKCDNFKIHVLSDKMPCYDAGYIWNNDVEGISLNVNGSLHFRLKNSRLSSVSADSFKRWLSANHVTIYYKMEREIVTEITPLLFKSGTRTTIDIKSDISPITNHTIVLNLGGQIERSIVKITELRKRVSALEELYSSRLIENQLKLSMLALDYELEKEE